MSEPDEWWSTERIVYRLQAVHGKGWRWLSEFGETKGPHFRFKSDAQNWAAETCMGKYSTKGFEGREHEPMSARKETEADWMGEQLFSDEELARLLKTAVEVKGARPSEAQLAKFIRRCELARAQEVVLRKLLNGELEVQGYRNDGEAVLVPAGPKAKGKE